jgi:CDGSH-type Zn-finger protein
MGYYLSFQARQSTRYMSDPRKKPRLTPLPDGPYLYENKLHPESGNLYDSEGEKIPCGETVTLCRCGGSANKPFCDGTHARIGFSGRNESDGHLDRRRDYAGAGITIHDNRCVCAHAKFCVDELPAVFHEGGKPWIEPDAAEPAEVIAVIEKCPSGALSYSVDGVEHKDLEREPAVHVTRDGPCHLVGGIEVDCEEARAEGVSREHCCCCRCGASKNKPFCDGSHLDVGFKDEGKA